jgi:hypothetical protein
MKKTFIKVSCTLLVACSMVMFMTNCKKEVSAEAQSVEELKGASSLSSIHSRCEAHERFEEMVKAHPEVLENRRKNEEFTRNFVANYDKTAQVRTVITIPVVIHVVYKTAAQNISDAQINNQIETLNRDFRRTNLDAGNTPAAFKPLAADVEINFVLAKQDPNGNPTTGIVRKQTTTTIYSNDNMMSSATGGSDIWDSKKYLNIYVCNIVDNLGYAYYPGAPADIDAAVILYKAFGSIGTAEAPYHLGRTATHEVGHWLNLIHIWGDDKGACNGSDEVADTPNQGGENTGCPTFPKFSCSNGANGDMFMNYMDYCDDACMNMFSTGQKMRMKALFAPGGAREGLLTSNGATAPSGTNNSCTDNYESNNTSSTAKTIAVNTDITAKIGAANDVDWFSFTTTTAQSKIKVTLTNLPLDYDVFLYKNNVLVGSSENDGTTAEQIILNTGTAGVYKVKVIGYNGVFSASNCYKLKAQIGSVNF